MSHRNPLESSNASQESHFRAAYISEDMDAEERSFFVVRAQAHLLQYVIIIRRICEAAVLIKGCR